MFPNCLFLTVSNENLTNLKYCLKSIVKYENRINYDILIFTDSKCYEFVCKIVNLIPKDRFPIFIVRENIEWSSTSKEHVFKRFYFIYLKLIEKYNIIMICDVNILVTLEISSLFEMKLIPNVVYVCQETNQIEDHNLEEYKPHDASYLPEDIQSFVESKCYPFTSDLFLFKLTNEIIAHFMKMLKLGEVTFPEANPQQLMNFYFGRRNLVQFDVFTYSNTCLNPDLCRFYRHKIIRFRNNEDIKKYYKHFIENLDNEFQDLIERVRRLEECVLASTNYVL